MYLNNDIINITFNKPFYKNYTKLYFLPNKDNIYYDNSHVNYIYKIEEKNVIITFYGFFKDSFFVIIFDLYNKELNTKIEYKDILFMKVDWILKKISETKSLWIIDTNKFINHSFNANILPIRNKIFSDQNIGLDDYIKIYNYVIYNITIKIVDKIDTEKKISIKDKILSIFKFNNEEIY